MVTLRTINPALLLLILISQAGTTYGLTIRFQRQTSVDNSFVCLGDVAEIIGEDPLEVQTYQTARLVPAPPNGGQLFLDFDTVRNRLRALGLSLSNVEFAGASRILVKGEGANTKSTPTRNSQASGNEHNDPTPDQLKYAKRIVQRVVRNNLMKQPNLFEVTDHEIDVKLHEQAIEVLTNSIPNEWQIQSWTRPQAGASQLTLKRFPSGQLQEAQTVECEIRMPNLILTVKQPILAGHTIQAVDIAWMYANRSAALIQPQQVIGMEAKQNLRPGEAIRADDLRKKPYVRPQDIVAVYSRQGGVTVKRTMRAIKGGGLGDAIPLVSLKGREQLTGRIIGFHKTEVIDSTN